VSSPRKPTLIHPYTYFLIEDGFSAIYDQLKTRNLRGALMFLYWLTVFLDNKGRTELKEVIEDIREILYRHNEMLNEDSLYRMVAQVTEYLHRENYFIQAKYEVPTRVGGVKALAHALGHDDDRIE
jgi:hypothetical protein